MQGWIRFTVQCTLEVLFFVFVASAIGVFVADGLARIAPGKFAPYTSAVYELRDGRTLRANSAAEIDAITDKYQGQIAGVKFSDSKSSGLTRAGLSADVAHVLLVLYVLVRARWHNVRWFRAGAQVLALGIAGGLVAYLLQGLWVALLATILGLWGTGESGGIPPLAFVVSSVAIAPLAEELYFRGHLYDLGMPRIGRTWTWVMTTLLFAACHHAFELPGTFAEEGLAGVFVLGAKAAIQFPSFIAGGLVFLWLRERSGGLIAPLLAHASVNALLLIDLPGRLGLI